MARYAVFAGVMLSKRDTACSEKQRKDNSSHGDRGLARCLIRWRGFEVRRKYTENGRSQKMSCSPSTALRGSGTFDNSPGRTPFVQTTSVITETVKKDVPA